MRRIVLTVISLALVGALVGTAKVNAAPRQGDSELQISGGYFADRRGDTGTLNAGLDYGFYLTPGWQLGFRQSVNYLFLDNQRDIWTATTAPFLNYHFRLGDVLWPYIGAFGGAVWNDRDVTGTVGPQAGVKLFVHDRAFVNVGYRYEWFFDRVRDIDDNFRRGNHVATIGVGFLFGGR